jgi:hypothetical protein
MAGGYPSVELLLGLLETFYAVVVWRELDMFNARQ